MAAASHYFDNKIILVTGGTGSWGIELVDQLFKRYAPKEVRIYSRGEEKQVWMRRKFAGNTKLKFIVGDIRDKARLLTATKDVHIIFHLAALKHVTVCEENPWEAVHTNTIGTQNVIEAAIENHVEKVVDVSSDKAVDPFNVYGTCKSLSEKLSVIANTVDDTRFVCVRGVNVLGTSGSVVPLFREQILRAGEITLTDASMTRFFMTLDHVVTLITKAAIEGVGGEIFVMRMPPVRIIDLAHVMIEELGDEKTRIKTIGIRPGEKLHEAMVSRYEIPLTVESDEFYIVLPNIDLPYIREKYVNAKRPSIQEYTSEHPPFATKESIRQMLLAEHLLRKPQANEADFAALSPDELRHLHEREGWVKRA